MKSSRHEKCRTNRRELLTSREGLRDKATLIGYFRVDQGHLAMKASLYLWRGDAQLCKPREDTMNNSIAANAHFLHAVFGILPLPAHLHAEGEDCFLKQFQRFFQ
jgi:hypothetical protein